MNKPDETNVINIPQTQVSFESIKYLTHFEKARMELELATTIDEIKSIRDLASAIQAYLKQSGESLEIQNMAAEIKVRSERKIGDILANIDFHKGGRNSINHSHDESGLPRLSDLNIDRNMSSRFQKISSIPEKDFEDRMSDFKKRRQELTSNDFLSLAGYLQREQERKIRREMAAEDARDVIPHDRIQIRYGDFREVLNDILDNSVNLILTDPIYLKENEDDWSQLSLFAARVLKQGKLLACYSSTNILAESIKRLSDHLDYVWTFAIVYPSTRKPHHPYRINGCWKPLLIFSNGTYQPDIKWINDVIQGDGITKDHHDWEQGRKESEYIIENLSVEDDLVVDPFMGSGTTAVAAKRLNRRFIGCDMDLDAINMSLSRISKEIGEVFSD